MSRGRTGNITLAKELSQITFYDVYQAVECVSAAGEPDAKLFRFHERPNPKCPVGKNIHAALDSKLDYIQRSMEDELRKITVEQVSQEIKNLNFKI